MTTRDGTPVWFELHTVDQDAAQTFYESVVGWRVAPSPMPEHGGYRIAATAGGERVAGIMKPPPEAPACPGWTVYFATADVDAAAARVAKRGGRIGFGPVDIPYVGRFAMASDPQGVAFALLAGAGADGGRAFALTAPGGERAFGHGVWIELATPDPAGAIDFYGALFGWEKLGGMPMGDMGEYAFIGCDGFRPGAVMSSTATGAPARWAWYVQVPDVDAAAAAARAAGGAVLQGPDPIPGGDYSARITDPAGSLVGLVGPRGPS